MNIVVGITGSIAAYKSAVLVRGLIKQGHSVKVVMTNAAQSFVSALTLSTLSKNDVHSEVFEGNSWNNHVELGLWADLMLIAPCTANTLAKMSHGLCDNMLMAVYLSAKCPVWVAPAMDLDMWKHPSTVNNLNRVASFDNHRIIDVDHGELASGLIGHGRMAEPESIVEEIGAWNRDLQLLKGKKALVTAGPTYEYIDPVRYIGNPSSGKMGVAIANTLAEKGCQVDLILGPTECHDLHKSIEVTAITSAAEMYSACESVADSVDLMVFAAAVADYTPETVNDKKTKKGDGPLSLNLKRTTDIAQTLGIKKRPDQISIGFALETHDAESSAQSKLDRKRFNMVVLNTLQDEGAGFQKDTNKVTIFDDTGRKVGFEVKSKKKVAEDIVTHYLNHYFKK